MSPLNPPNLPSGAAPSGSRFRAGPVELGGPGFVVMAGPCSIESREQFLEIAQAVKGAGATMLRGGIFKMRTHSHSFQGLGEGAFEIADEVRARTGLPLISEVTDPRQIPDLGEIVDVLQVGARNMYNYELLKELGRSGLPVLVKRAFSATVEEWLAAAEYVRVAGNPQVALCERGIRTFERITRNTLDLSAVAYIKANSDLPVIVDPSHGTGVRALIKPMCLAAAAAGADGILLEVHSKPATALSDGQQALTIEDFREIMRDLKTLLPALGRELHSLPQVPARAGLKPGAKPSLLFAAGTAIPSSGKP
ncbi:MAG: 3-deoxy-7-phosphoheptulonate synthase [Oligoflexia bacterium]|nr:3-deoxy-7-phosphoheptulonate synthase [Oligoflexia bacterium]